MTHTIATAILTPVLALFTAGLIFSFIRRRQTGEEYLLFWRLSPTARAVTRPMFFRGTFAEIIRILLFATVTLLFAVDLHGPNNAQN